MVTRDEFVFFDDFLAIDFVNTEIIRRRKRYDLMATPADMTLWGAVAQDRYGARGLYLLPEWFPSVREFRTGLRDLFDQLVAHGAVDASRLAVLNDVLAQAHPSIMTDEPRGVYLDYTSAIPIIQHGLLPIVLSTLDILTQHDISRLRHCRNDHCILFFYDKSKNGTREWCSTACMNRARSAQHYREAHKHDE